MMKTLLVDPDVQSKQRFLQLIDWSELGYRIHAPEQQSYEEILQAIDKGLYALVIINMKSLPSFSMQLCEQIRKISQVPIVLVGGYKDFHLVRKAIALHVSDYLPDPYQAEDLIACLNNVRIRHQSMPAASSTTNSTTGIIELVKRYVDEQMHKSITLKEISRILHFNCAYLGQKFKRHENMTFNEYLLQQRMEKAKKLLLETDMKIYEIAHKVGYSEVDWFYKKFREYTGKSANEFRKKPSYTA